MALKNGGGIKEIKISHRGRQNGSRADLNLAATSGNDLENVVMTIQDVGSKSTGVQMTLRRERAGRTQEKESGRKAEKVNEY